MVLKSTNKIDTNRYKLEISVDAETFEEGIQKVFKKECKKIFVPGFRKGKAPRSFIEKYYGENIFFEKAVNETYPAALDAAIKEAGLEVVDDKIDLDVLEIGKEGYVFTAELTTKPEVSIADYKGIEVEKKSVEVTDDDVNEEIDRAKEKVSRLVTVEDRAAQNDDVAVINFKGFVDDVAFEGGESENFPLTLGSGQFIPGFEEQIVGHNIGDEFDVNVKFPEDYQAENLKGKDAVFKVKLNEIKFKEYPEINDEFAKDVSEFDTLEEYKEDLKKNILERKQKESDNDVTNQIIDKLIELMEAEIPQAMFENKINDDIKEFAYRLQSQNIDLNTYMQYTGLDRKSIREGFRDQAEKQVKLRLALEKIAQMENFEVTPEELEEEYKKIAEIHKMELEQVKSFIAEKDLTNDVKVDKAMKLVKETANIK